MLFKKSVSDWSEVRDNNNNKARYDFLSIETKKKISQYHNVTANQTIRNVEYNW